MLLIEYSYSDKVKEVNMGGALTSVRKIINAYSTLIAKLESKRLFRKNTVIDGKIILQFIINKRGVN
jgi:hypothetical protein